MQEKEKKGIQIYVAVKCMGNITKKVKSCPLVLEYVPNTLRELIEEAVKSCVSAYEQRAKSGNAPSPHTQEQLEAMENIGKLAFGVHYNKNKIDIKEAIKTATDALSDGLVRVFCGNDELTDLDAEIAINEREVFTFVRLTMLSGRMW